MKSVATSAPTQPNQAQRQKEKWIWGSFDSLHLRYKRGGDPTHSPAQLKAASAHGDWRPLILPERIPELEPEKGPQCCDPLGPKGRGATWARKRSGRPCCHPVRAAQHSPTLLGPHTQLLVESPEEKGALVQHARQL